MRVFLRCSNDVDSLLGRYGSKHPKAQNTWHWAFERGPYQLKILWNTLPQWKSWFEEPSTSTWKLQWTCSHSETRTLTVFNATLCYLLQEIRAGRAARMWLLALLIKQLNADILRIMKCEYKQACQIKYKTVTLSDHQCSRCISVIAFPISLLIYQNSKCD